MPLCYVHKCVGRGLVPKRHSTLRYTGSNPVRSTMVIDHDC